DYYCVYHGGTTATGKNNPLTSMNGTLVVQGEAAPTPAASNAPSSSPAATTNVHGQSASQGSTGSGLANTGGPAIFGWAMLPLGIGLAVRPRRLGLRRRQQL